VIKILLGDCRDSMRSMQENSVDAIVSDPPYGLGFMGKGWDHGVPGAEFWAEALRVAKPGAYLLAFGGTRTFHRLTVAIEDAGWEIRDCIMWVYSSGFPKSHDVSKSFDRSNGVLKAEGKGFTVAGYSHNDKLLTTAPSHGYTPPQPVTESAKQWEGWGTALKPAWEPIIVARKPMMGTIVENVERFGVGGINIDGCRVGTNDDVKIHSRSQASANSSAIFIDKRSLETHQTDGQRLGRWPANLIHDGSDEVIGLFPDVDGTFGMKKVEGGHRFIMGDTTTVQKFDRGFMDSGSAARFFYCAKASQRDRNDGCELLAPKRESDRVLEDGVGGDNPRNRSNHARQNHHPCVKPTDLMRYLCRLVTPPGGIVLDPFMGSGSTGKGAVSEGFSFIGCELDPDYVEIARARIAHVGGAEDDAPVKQEAKQKGDVQLSLFGGGQ
jgi:site-specific DNA-methyltransferase (adenine-specific)